MSAHKNKVLAYITHGNRLLVFRHPHAPEAGIQVPAGTVEKGEDPEVPELIADHGTLLPALLGKLELT